MKEYFIRGRILEAEIEQNEDDDTRTCPTGGYTAPKERLRVEVWDRDVRFDDRLAAATTDSKGIFELRFTDADFRLEPGESELEPDVFFQVFRQRQLLFSTEAELLPEDFDWQINQITLPTDINSYATVETCYRLTIDETAIAEIPDPQERPITPEVIPEDTVVDILPTSEQVFGFGRRSSVSTTATNSGGSLQQKVDRAFSRVLGQTFRSSDSGSFRNSLNQAFTLQENNGSRDYIWNPRSYTTQTELGGDITGAQASLYHRAKAALKEILPLLDGLYELDPAADEQNRDAVRSIVRTEIIELVNEMGVHQGPRVQRVDSLFQLLIGSEDASRLPEQIGGQLRDLADAFGLNRSSINTVDEERNYGNFLIIRDYLVSLRKSWDDFILIQKGGGGAFVGTQLVLLSQALSVMAESVRETYRIMDLVFLGHEERQSLWLDFTQARAENMPNNIAFPLPDGTGYSIRDTLQLEPAMDLERLLSWVMRFATEEGPTLARSGGKLGIANVITQTAERLMILLQAASYVPVRNSAFRREGAKRALRDLAFQTSEVKRLAEELIPPTISGQPDDIGDRPLIPPNNGDIVVSNRGARRRIRS